MEIDVTRQQQAREYAHKRRRLSFISMGIALLGVILVLVSGLNTWINMLLQSGGNTGWLAWQPRAGWYPLQIILYFLVLFLAYEIVTLPLSYYSGFVLPRRYNISVMTLPAWLKDLAIGFVLSIIFEAAFISLVYTLLAFQPQWWWLYAAIIILFFSVIMANLAPILLFPLFYKFTPLPEGELTERLLSLVSRANTHVRGIYSMKMSHKTNATNAALMGLGNTRRIVLGDTMTDRYTIDEIEVILAHELGHHVHRDIWRLIASQTILTLISLFIANLILHLAIGQWHWYPALTATATLPFFFLISGIFGFLIMPLSNGYTRHVEYQADEYALQATGKIQDFKNAMTRLANQNLSDIDPEPWVELLFHSHPSIKKRLQHADEFVLRPTYVSNASLSADS
ncbi:MAG TPA: M48 family metallopeptidase [Dictyobacter sp.]|nr:M48 family metallopeptidase [Dictyobacter sp.]